MSGVGKGVSVLLMLGGGICWLLLPPVLYRLYQYREFKPMVQEVLQLRKVIRRRAGQEGEEQENQDAVQGDLMQVRTRRHVPFTAPCSADAPQCRVAAGL